MRGKEYVLQIGFHDRLGLGFEIFRLLKSKNINLLGMEAKINGKMTIKFSGVSLEELNQFIFQLKEIKGVHSITFQHSIPYEQNSISFEDIIYQSDRMKRVIETAAMVSKSKSTILLRGESGTGKELFAKAIHRESNRFGLPFVVLNCAALPENLLESELFGYEEGSFTGASKGGKKGLFEQADKGTLFLDEIGELSLNMQVRLLRVLQENTIRRIGSHKEINIDVRIIAATHRNLEEMVNQNVFREDLYYRLNVVPIHIPPLRERKEDIPFLIKHLIQKICTKLERPEVQFPNESMNYLVRQAWPGNIRQLENALERILNVVTRPEITVFDICQWLNIDAPQRFSSPDENMVSFQININKDFPQLKDILDEVEKKIILQVLKTHDSSRKAGKVLGISNTTVLNKMKKYGIDYIEV